MELQVSVSQPFLLRGPGPWPWYHVLQTPLNGEPRFYRIAKTPGSSQGIPKGLGPLVGKHCFKAHYTLCMFLSFWVFASIFIAYLGCKMIMRKSKNPKIWAKFCVVYNDLSDGFSYIQNMEAHQWIGLTFNALCFFENAECNNQNISFKLKNGIKSGAS